MKFYDRKLLDHFQQVGVSVDEPLKNVKSALGSLRHVEGNPLTKTEITLNVSVIFQAIPGGIIPPAALPAGMQTSISVSLFGLTDFFSGYSRLNQINPIGFGWVLSLGVNSFGIYGLDVFGGIAAGRAVNGDMILTYQDGNGIGFPNFAATVIIHCENVPYGTFLNSFVSDLITLDTIRYIVPAANINQFINPIIFGTQSLFGKVATDNIDPRIYITNKDFQPQISDIPIDLPIDKTLMIGLQMDVFCPNFSWVLFVKKVEALTHKR